MPKKMHFDYHLLSVMKRLPLTMREKIAHTSMFGSVGACFLSYDIDIETGKGTPAQVAELKRTLRNNFNLFSGFDTCGACALLEMREAGVESLKIVGRSNPFGKKVKDVRFLKACIDFLEGKSPSKEEFVAFTKKKYEKVFGFSCDSWCYFPAEDAALDAGVL